ncbi:hypothetical protein Nepgr_014511 [Nepenthes gracilis]|uniref:Mitochondrial fission protein ELM1 n=1 Tax=Nepenthes gracilis TaxID=150966 RepID=A0AAD3SKZ4_NEPGR|nr:hypothetical protein Nepgr_014511 [Nepenthes gracilis]
MRPVRLSHGPLRSPRGLTEILDGSIDGVIHRAVVIGSGFLGKEKQCTRFVPALEIPDKPSHHDDPLLEVAGGRGISAASDYGFAGQVRGDAALHQIDSAALTSAAGSRHDEFAHLPKPLIVVNIGAPSRHCRYGAELAKQLAAYLRIVLPRCGTVRISFSEKTPKKVSKVIMKELRDDPKVHISGSKEPNPRTGHLACADAFIVTADSISALSEACSTGKPVYVAGDEFCTGKLSEFHKKMKERGFARPLMASVDSIQIWLTDSISVVFFDSTNSTFRILFADCTPVLSLPLCVAHFRDLSSTCTFSFTEAFALLSDMADKVDQTRPISRSSHFTRLVSVLELRDNQSQHVRGDAALHQIDSAALTSAAGSRHDEFAHLPKPLIVVNIGAPSRHCRYGAELAKQLAAYLRIVLPRCGTVRISFSEKTPKKVSKVIMKEPEMIPKMMNAMLSSEPNPRTGHLACADAFIVTADSISALSEACSTGKPVYVAGDEFAPGSCRSSIRR